MPEALISSRADSTTKKYAAGFHKWKLWADKYEEVTILPANPMYVSLYLLSLVQNINSVSTLEAAAYSISWAHKISQLPDPVSDNIVINVLQSLRRKLAKRPEKKEIITIDNLQELLSIHQPLSNPDNLRNMCIYILSFAGFLRFDELINLKLKNINFHDSHMTILIERSKTDQLREGTNLIIARTHTALCPVQMLRNWLNLFDDMPSNSYIFRAFYKNKAGNLLFKSTNKPIAYSTVRDKLKKSLEKIGLDSKKYGMHSLRSGAASAAANSGINDRLFKRHGRWRSDKAKDGYIKDDLAHLLSVSQNLGL